MAPQIVLRQSLLDTNNSSLSSSSFPSNGKAGFGEMAGGATAECAAVCCCCPCGLVDLVVLTVYKVPAGLCRKALRRRRRRRLMKKGLLPPKGHHRTRCQCGCDDTEIQIHPVPDLDPDKLVMSLESDEDVIELEREMWDQFYGGGFWRSPSQRVGWHAKRKYPFQLYIYMWVIILIIKTIIFIIMYNFRSI